MLLKLMYMPLCIRSSVSATVQEIVLVFIADYIYRI
jgi:hypothetical protein